MELKEAKAENHRRRIGLVFLACALGMFGILVYAVFEVLTPLTQTSPVYEQMAAEFVSEISKENAKVDKVTLDLLISLEYASAKIRLVGVQIAFGILSGLFLTATGILLLSAGFSGALDFAGEAKGVNVKLATATPGVLLLFVGGVVMAISILKNPDFAVSTETKRPFVTDVDVSTKPPPGPGRVESSLEQEKAEGNSETFTSPTL